MFFSSENMNALAMIIILRLTRTISGGESFENFHFCFDLTCEKWDNLKIIKFPCCWYHFINLVLQAHHLWVQQIRPFWWQWTVRWRSFFPPHKSIRVTQPAIQRKSRCPWITSGVASSTSTETPGRWPGTTFQSSLARIQDLTAGEQQQAILHTQMTSI